jgi:hypothetical protein
LNDNRAGAVWITLNRQFKPYLKTSVNQAVTGMVSEGKGRLFKRKDGKYLVYIPKDLAEDSMFPFKGADSMFVKVSFELGDGKLLVEKWSSEPPKQ